MNAKQPTRAGKARWVNEIIPTLSPVEACMPAQQNEKRIVATIGEMRNRSQSGSFRPILVATRSKGFCVIRMATAIRIGPDRTSAATLAEHMYMSNVPGVNAEQLPGLMIEPNRREG